MAARRKTIIVLTIFLTMLASCNDDTKNAKGADIFIHYESLTSDQRRRIESIAYTYSDNTLSMSESMFNNSFTLRIWLADKNKFKDLGRSEQLKNIIEEVKVPDTIIVP